MPAEAEALFREREEILNAMVADMLTRVSDFHNEQDGVFRLSFEVYSAIVESVFVALQVLSEDMFVHTANYSALQRHGVTYGTPMKTGTPSEGDLLFSGVGGTYIGIGSEVAYDPATGADALFFTTVEDDTIPNPGIPTAPTLADQAVGVLAAGTYEYTVTFITAGGETVPGAESAPLVLPANRQIRLTAISLGGPGTTKRHIYRSVDGGAYGQVAEINDNVTVQYDDNLAVPTSSPLLISTAERITLHAQSDSTGVETNVSPASISVLSDVPDGVLAVTNWAAFVGGSDPQDMEDFRESLLQAVRDPGSGSPGDLKQWAEEVPGVETATVFSNNNLGVAQNGHTTIRIAGPNGVIPSTDVQSEVLTRLTDEGLTNIIYHVATFTQVSTAVTVDIVLETDFILGEVSPNVSQAITDFINSREVGQTLVRADLIAAIVEVPGVFDLDIGTLVPATNLATTATEKRIPGTITIT